MKTSSEESKQEVKDGCILSLISIAISPAAIVWKGYVLTILWAWFIVPIFGLAAITIPQAIGLALIILFVTPTPSSSKSKDEFSTRVALAIFLPFMLPAFVLLIGWIVNHWM